MYIIVNIFVYLIYLIKYTWDSILEKEIVQDVGFEPRIFHS